MVPDMLQRLLHLGCRLDSFLEHRCRINTYEQRNGLVVRHRGLFNEDPLMINDIANWQVTPEMTFDIVDIELGDGSIIRWLDEYDDLLSILRTAASEREITR